MHGTGPLVDLLLVLLLAKVASEVAERLSLPGVVGEILAGVIAGPSLLGWVHDSEVILFLGEVGVILLLLEVGLEMDLGELGAVGKAALSVAVAGVVLPFVGGAGAGLALGMTGTEAIFVGAALTATSVGITARVFGDLRALTSVEARTVLGAAVADDVLGLIILTVVVRLVEVGSINALAVGELIVVAVGFLAVATLVGLRVVPPAIDRVQRWTRAPGTLVALVVAFTLGMAHLASLAKLAPIIGAFVAGICLTRSPARHRIASDLGPLSHVLVPVFFFRIGMEADLAEFADPGVLGLAAVLMVVAVLGKLAASLVMGKAPGDRLLIGLGMLPRGEVGLIFATIGLQQGVFGNDVYASMLLVVLGTTLLAPPLLRARLVKVRARAGATYEAEPRPDDGWLMCEGGVVELRAHPPEDQVVAVGLEAALLMDEHRPGESLLRWIDSLPADLPAATPALNSSFGAFLQHAGVRAWRFLYVTGLLQRVVPELDAAVRRQVDDPFDPDPLGALQWPRVAALHDGGRVPSLVAVLAATVLDATDGDTGPEARHLGAALAQRVGLGQSGIRRVIDLVADADLLVGMAPQRGFTVDEVRQLAGHLGDRSRLDDLVALTDATTLEPHVRVGVDALVAEVERILAATAGEDPVSVAARIEAAMPLVGDLAADRLRSAPPAFVLRVPVGELAHQALFCEPPPGADQPRVEVRPGVSGDRWRVGVVARDRAGLLAGHTQVLAALGLDVVAADAVTWSDGVALAVFDVTSPTEPDAADLVARVRRQAETPLTTAPLGDVELEVDQAASPWHTVIRAVAPDRVGLLAALTAAFAAAGARVEAARVETVDGRAMDRFELAGPGGDKLTPAEVEAIRGALAAGVVSRKRPLRREWTLAAAP